MQTSPRFLAAVITAASLFPGLANAEKLLIPDPNYASGRATAFAVKGIVEEALGLEVETVPVASVPVVWEALARGTGEIDIWTETWLPNQGAPKAKYADQENLVTVGEKSFPAVPGMGTADPAPTHKDIDHYRHKEGKRTRKEAAHV